MSSKNKNEKPTRYTFKDLCVHVPLGVSKVIDKEINEKEESLLIRKIDTLQQELLDNIFKANLTYQERLLEAYTEAYERLREMLLVNCSCTYSNEVVLDCDKIISKARRNNEEKL